MLPNEAEISFDPSRIDFGRTSSLPTASYWAEIVSRRPIGVLRREGRYMRLDREAASSEPKLVNGSRIY